MRDLSRARYDGTRTLPSFVGIDATLHAPRDGAAQDATQGLFHAESTTEHVHEDRRHLADMEAQHDK